MRIRLLAALLVALCILFAGAVAENGTSLLAAPAGGGSAEAAAPVADGTMKQRVCGLIGFLCPFATELYRTVAKPSSPLNWLFLLSALLIATAVYLAGPGAGKSAKGLLYFLFPKRVWLGRSALTDYQFYLTAVAITLFVNFSGLVVTGEAVGLAVERALVAFGDARSPSAPSTALLLVYGLFNLLAVDFGFFFAHYLLHRVPVLWELHKVHHAADSLTPLTAFRFHPLEVVLAGASISLCAGTVDGVFRYLLGGEMPSHVKYLNYGVIIFGVHLFENLRHSHVWLSYGWHLSHILNSPAQHQIHHSCEPRHFDKNFGQVFSIWDWAFGTLYVPRGKETFQMGLSRGEHTEYYSLWGCYVLPFIKIGRLLAGLARASAGKGPAHRG